MTGPGPDPARLREEVVECETRLRALHKQLRLTRCHEATWTALDAADKALAAARALAAELPARRPAGDPRAHPELYICG